MEAYDAEVKAVLAENTRLWEENAAAVFAFDDYRRRFEERKHSVAVAANAHKAATREALIAWESKKAVMEKEWNAAVNEVNKVNAVTLKAARAKFDDDEKVRDAQRKAAEKEHEEMEKALREHHKSLEMSDELFKWKSVRYNISNRRENIAKKLKHFKRQTAMAVTHKKSQELLKKQHDDAVVGLYKLNVVDPELESACFFNLKCDFLVSKFCFQIQMLTLHGG
jgi:hypothetical protein